MGCTASSAAADPQSPHDNKRIYAESLTFYRSDDEGNPTEAVPGYFYTTGSLQSKFIITIYSTPYRSQAPCALHFI